ncbi:MAG: GvpL/GvpF family gas vesicle protein [Elusimicrobia bacterium]|nr:GvpL/GvpF family gas vesicle protein [Elusimicrobiota bacterium]
MGKTGKYVYGIIASAAPEFARPGAIAEFAEIYTLSHLDVAAVVGDREAADYRHMRKEALALLLVRHQKVIERIMELGHAIIPVRLGTFAADEAEVRKILRRGYRLIKEIIPKVRDKIEVDVAVVWKDLNSVIKEIGEGKEIAALKKALLSNPNGVSVEDQMKVGLAVKKALDDKRRHGASLIEEALRTMSHDCRAHELMDDRMVMNSAFLIRPETQDAFYARVESLNGEFDESLDFRCIGPLPPYSFYTVEIKKLDYKDLKWAREKLGLPDDLATESEIKQAYHRAAVSLHPDKNPNRPGMEKEFGNAARARKILAEYCLASMQAEQEENVFCSEDNPDESALWVRVGQ